MGRQLFRNNKKAQKFVKLHEQPAHDPDFVCSCGKEMYGTDVDLHEDENEGHVVVSKQDQEMLQGRERDAFNAGELEL